MRRPVLTRRLLDALIDCYTSCEAGGFEELIDAQESLVEEKRTEKNLHDAGKWLFATRDWMDRKQKDIEETCEHGRSLSFGCCCQHGRSHDSGCPNCLS